MNELKHSAMDRTLQTVVTEPVWEQFQAKAKVKGQSMRQRLRELVEKDVKAAK